MRILLPTALALLVLAACGGQSTSPAPAAISASSIAPPAHSAPAQAPTPVDMIVDVPKIAGKPQQEVTAILGEPISCEDVKQGKKCFFRRGQTEVVFISGKADWITIEALDDAPYSDDVLPHLGLEKTAATFSNENTIRWETVRGVLEVSIFSAQDGVDYAHIKTSTP